MTIDNVIASVDSLRPNLLSRKEKISLLSLLDRSLFCEVLCKYERFGNDFAPYTESTPGERILALPDEYAYLYLLWLFACISKSEGEQDLYAVDAENYNKALEQIKRSLLRRFIPKGECKIKRSGGMV